MNLNAGTYSLSFLWAGKTSSSVGKVYWNGVLISDLIPVDQNIKLVTISVTAKAGANTLVFEAIGDENT